MSDPVTTSAAAEDSSMGFLSDISDNKSSDSDDSLSDGPDFLSSAVPHSEPLAAAATDIVTESEQRPAEDSSMSQEQHTTFSLDSLLQDKKNAVAEQQKTQAMQARLKRESLSGNSDVMEENAADEGDYEDFTDEQKHTLKKLRLEDDEIQDSPPGEPVFNDQLLGQLFTESVSPAACGVSTDSHNCLHQLLDHYQPGTLMDLLSSDVISLVYRSLPCKFEVQRWLLFLMSVHSNAVQVEKCADQLLQMLQWQMGDVSLGKQKHTFTPPLLDLFRIFVNWGADKRDLVFDSSVTACQQLSEVLPLSSSLPQEGANPTCHRNFEVVLKMLSCWLQARPSYSAEELNQLLVMLCKLSLDPSLCKSYLLYELQVCLASVLECYKPSQWKSVVPWLCHKLKGLSSHHHNQVYITQLFTVSCPRGQYLQQRLAFLLFHSALVQRELTDQQIHDFQMLDLLSIIPELKHLLQSDRYQLSSLVHLLDLSVGPAAQHMTQRKQLFQLLEAVRLIVAEIRDSMQRLDCTKVKDMLLHLCLKWDISVKASNIRQRKIFSCFPSKTQMQVEQLEDKAADCSETVPDDASAGFSDCETIDEEECAVAADKSPKTKYSWTDDDSMATKAEDDNRPLNNIHSTPDPAGLSAEKLAVCDFVVAENRKTSNICENH